MTIEQKCNTLLKRECRCKRTGGCFYCTIEEWKWKKWGDGWRDETWPDKELCNELIKMSDPIECLTSNSEYIRGYVLQLMENK